MNTTDNCPFCEQLTRLSDFDEYHRDLCVYASALKLIRYYEQIDNEHCCRQTTYSFDELNFCPVCGKKIPEYMTNRKVPIKCILVKTDHFSEKQSVNFINSELYFDRFTHLPKSSAIPSPTVFYRFIGGKRFLVIADYLEAVALHRTERSILRLGKIAGASYVMYLRQLFTLGKLSVKLYNSQLTHTVHQKLSAAVDQY